jgi:ABC-type antimicrobial peptide transport system permease subunit
VGRGIALTAVGLALGAVAVRIASPALERLLASVSPGDPTVLGSIAGLLLVTGVVASWIPALRAARVDPAASLRSD